MYSGPKLNSTKSQFFQKSLLTFCLNNTENNNNLIRGKNLEKRPSQVYWRKFLLKSIWSEEKKVFTSIFKNFLREK